MHALRGCCVHRLPEAFTKVSDRAGGAKADLASHVAVALGAINRTWMNATLSPTLRKGIVGNLLDNLTRDRRAAEVEWVLQNLEEFGQLVLKSTEFGGYLRDWRTGHFI